MGRLNKIMLIGNAGNDAELRYTPNGDGVASFSLAVGNRYTNREGQQIDETEWFRVTSWDGVLNLYLIILRKECKFM